MVELAASEMALAEQALAAEKDNEARLLSEIQQIEGRIPLSPGNHANSQCIRGFA